MIHRLTTAEVHAVLDGLTEDDMARARASLARDTARREQAATDAPTTTPAVTREQPHA